MDEVSVLYKEFEESDNFDEEQLRKIKFILRKTKLRTLLDVDV